MFNGKGYPEKQLSEVCKKITDGTHKTPKYLGEGVTFISAKNIINGRLDFSDIKYISESEYQEIQKRCQTEKGDVLLAKSGSLGMTAIVENDESLGLFESLAILKYDRMLLNGVFLCRQMQSDAVQSQLMSNVKGVAVKHLHLNVIAKTKIIVPPMDLQERFCAFARQSDKSKFACLKSQFIEMFKYINHDEYKTLDDVCILITDGTHNPPKFVESGIPFILVSNITGNIVTYETPKYITENDYRVLMKRTPIEKGDVLLSTVGSYGHPAIVTEDRPFAFQRHIAHLKPNRDLLTSEYLHAAILSSIVQEQIEILILGVAQKTLNLSAIRQIKIPVPSIEEQNVFVSFVEQSDKSK